MSRMTKSILIFVGLCPVLLVLAWYAPDATYQIQESLISTDVPKEGDRIAFLNGGRCSSWFVISGCTSRYFIHIVRPDGSGEARLSQQLVAPLSSVSWSPDGARLLFESVDKTAINCRTNAVMVINADGSGLKQLARGTNPTWSPDGKQIAFHVFPDCIPLSHENAKNLKNVIYVMNADGSQERLIGEGGLNGAVWSPDGKRLVYTRGGGGVDLALMIVNADGSAPFKISMDESIKWVNGNWTPDGKQIIYAADDGKSSRVRRFDLATGTQTDETGTGIPIWSPDKSHYLETRDEKIFIENQNGSGERLLTVGLGPSWAPDGKRIIFSKGCHECTIYVMDIDSGTEKKIADGFYPVWSPK